MMVGICSNCDAWKMTYTLENNDEHECDFLLKNPITSPDAFLAITSIIFNELEGFVTTFTFTLITCVPHQDTFC